MVMLRKIRNTKDKKTIAGKADKDYVKNLKIVLRKICTKVQETKM